MIGGNGWCGWPATGGGGGLEYMEHFIHANNLFLIPGQDSFRINLWYNNVLNGDKDVICLEKETEFNSDLVIWDSLDIADPQWELHLVWEEENGSHGTNHEHAAGIIVYQHKQQQTLSRNMAAALTPDGAPNDEDIIITDMTANLDIQTKPNPLTAPPYYLHIWGYRGSDQASGVSCIHGIRLRYKVST